MSHTRKPTNVRRKRKRSNPAIFNFSEVNRLRIAVARGFGRFLSSPLSMKDTVLMILLGLPGLLMSGLLTIPPMIFESPEQQAYFYFGQMVNEDPARWVVLGLAAILSVVALALPAKESDSSQAVRY